MQTFYGFVQTTNDALLLFEACRIGKLKRIQRRLSESERLSQVVSGSVFIWDEEESGIKRWTDGKTWSPSRIHGSFLIYKEMEPTSKRKNITNSGSEESPSGVKEDGLIKKALSICTANNKRQHLVSYYSREDFDNARLPIPSELHEYTSISIPSELYPEFVPETVPTVNGSMGYFYCDPNVRGIEGQQAAQRQPQYQPLALPSTEIVNVQPTANATEYEREMYQHNLHYRTPPSNDYQQTQHSQYQQNYQSRAPSPRYLDNQPTPPQVEGWSVDRYPYRAAVGHHHYAERSHPYARPPLMPNRISAAGQAYGRDQYLPPSPTSHTRNVYQGYSVSPTSRSANRLPQQAYSQTAAVYNHSRRSSGNQSIPPSPVSNQHLRQSNGTVNVTTASEEVSDQSCSDNRFALPPPISIQNPIVDSSSSSSYFPSNAMIKPLSQTSNTTTGTINDGLDNTQNLPPSPSQSQSISVTTAVKQETLNDPLNQVSSATVAQVAGDPVKSLANITLPSLPYTKMATSQQVTNSLSSFN
ncbi:hypothetical protein LY90DRAFT_678032 [Neocallimastix californiae]|jgi:hypothetical protein|uniref:Uncharacterized protein n=1 Tax=Neocallimastix californiae TaxID=1754190 RepID=A0A1Y1ZIR6_9FUNG|nr:hypothetical protein LY90DRAFT_678032 [Neocallimastix californiae]|eukprot:ORY10150.1 hypothetical protein LY90DRAFT_678032 [Neocallimastix californiae]